MYQCQQTDYILDFISGCSLSLAMSMDWFQKSRGEAGGKSRRRWWNGMDDGMMVCIWRREQIFNKDLVTVGLQGVYKTKLWVSVVMLFSLRYFSLLPSELQDIAVTYCIFSYHVLVQTSLPSVNHYRKQVEVTSEQHLKLF